MIHPAFELCTLPDDAVLVAHVIDAWGVKGGLKIAPYSAAPQALFSSKRWYFCPPIGKSPLLAAQQSSSSPSALPSLTGHHNSWLARIKTSKTQADSVMATVDGIDSRTEAETLKGFQIYIPRSSFPTPEEDEYYWVDLIGLSVYNREDVLLGTVRELLAAGPQTTLVLSPNSQLAPPPKPAKAKEPLIASSAQTKVGKMAKHRTEPKHPDILIPFVSRYIDKVDLQARTISVDWQADYAL